MKRGSVTLLIFKNSEIEECSKILKVMRYNNATETEGRSELQTAISRSKTGHFKKLSKETDSDRRSDANTPEEIACDRQKDNSGYMRPMW